MSAARRRPRTSRWVQGGGVPGGHHVLYDGRKPFIPSTREFGSVELRHSDVVVDIGAYVGTFAIRAARFPVKHVTAYEPTPETFGVLSLTSLPNLTTVQAAVVPDDRESVDLYVSQGIGVTNSIVLSRKKHAVTVPAVRYEDAVRDATVVKIDVEGAEYLFPIIQPTIRVLLVDFHPLPSRPWKDAASAMVRDIEAAGFEPIITPNWESGWQRAGTWVLPTEETPGGYEPMLSGQECCGCGTQVDGDGLSLCPRCWEVWLPRHRIGYGVAPTAAAITMPADA